MTTQRSTCAICGNKSVALSENKKLRYELKNPGLVEVTADVYECSRCGETYLDEKNMEKVAAEIDKAKGSPSK